MRHDYLMMTTRLIPLVLITPAAGQAQNYAVRLSIPKQVGQIYNVTATASNADSSLIGGRLAKAVLYQVDFHGSVKVLEVDGRKEATKLEYTVDSFTKTESGMTSDLLKSGAVIIADDSQDEPISLKEGALEEPVLKAFHLVHSRHKPSDVTDDDVFGTKERKSIGDSWPLNASLALVSEGFKDSGISVRPEQLTGTVSVIAENKLANLDCLSLRGEIRADGLSWNALPPGLTLDRASVHEVFQGCYPIADSGRSYKKQVDLTIQMQITSQDDVKVEMTRTTKTETLWVSGQ